MFETYLKREHLYMLCAFEIFPWFGDGEIYSVWQYDDATVLEEMLPWQQGKVVAVIR